MLKKKLPSKPKKPRFRITHSHLWPKYIALQYITSLTSPISIMRDGSEASATSILGVFQKQDKLRRKTDWKDGEMRKTYSNIMTS